MRPIAALGPELSLPPCFNPAIDDKVETAGGPVDATVPLSAFHTSEPMCTLSYGGSSRHYLYLCGFAVGGVLLDPFARAELPAINRLQPLVPETRN